MATKKDLVSRLMLALPYMKSHDIDYAINSVIDYLTSSLCNGYRIELRGFGSLSLRKRRYAKKQGEYNTVYYRMSKNLCNRLNAAL